MNHSLLLDALACRNTSRRPPVWLMRQAGRHLASYRKIRSRCSFLQMCHDPALIAEVTQLPIDAYGLDAAILFSDILVIPEAMGVGLRFEDQVGPIIERPIQSPQQIEDLPPVNIEKLQYVAQGIALLKRVLKIPLIGFCGAPFTVASYMIEGKSSRDLKKTKRWMMQDPVSFSALLNKITDWSSAYLRMQAASGVDAIQIFDSWAHFLSHRDFRAFSLNYMQKLLQTVNACCLPSILFCKGSSVFADQIAELSPAGIGLDWNCHLPKIRQQVGDRVCLQGNLDPDILYAPLDRIKDETLRLLDDMRGDRGFIFNLGHGIPPDVTEEAVRTLVESVKSY